jgi:hypothetical protein
MSQLSLAQQQAKVTNSALIPTVTEVLKSDDRAFLRLEKLMADLACSERADGNATVESETLSRKYGRYNLLENIVGNTNIIAFVGLPTSTQS